MNVLSLMLAPFVECLILVGIHSYLGLHVIRRRIIFVDLALAQIAALGTTVGFLFGIQPETTASFIFALTFCVLGAGLFSLTRMRSDRVPQEAIIGLVYAITAALAVLVVQKTKGAEHLEDLLVGTLLWVKWSDVGYAAAIYAVIGAIHFVFRRQFLLISEHPDEAYRRKMVVRLWDFVFYASFGLVIAVSVRVAGVLLVFVFLVAPAILGVMLTSRFRTQLVVGWIAGTLVTTVGLYLSYVLDLPSGPTVIGLYGFVLALAALVVGIARSSKKRATLVRVGLGLAVTAAIGMVLLAEGRMLARDGHANEPDILGGATRHGHHTGLPGSQPSAPDQQPAPDYEQALQAIRASHQKGDGRAAGMLLRLLERVDTPPFFREEAVKLLFEIAGKNFGYRPDVDVAQNKPALDSIRAWASSLDLKSAPLRR